MVDTFTSTSLYQRSPLDILSRQSSAKIPSPKGFFTPSPSASASNPQFVTRHSDSTTGTPHSPVSPLLQTRFKAQSGSSTTASSYRDFRGEDDDSSATRSVITNPARRDDDSWPRDDDDSSIYYDNSHDSLNSQTLTYPTLGFKYVLDAVNNKSTDPPSPVPSSPGVIIPDEQRLSYASATSAYTIKDEHTRTGPDGYSVVANDPNIPDPSLVPQVVVSAPAPSIRGSFSTDRTSMIDQSHPQRALTQYSVSNFSRPRRQFNQADSSEQRKLEVLERNRPRSPSSRASTDTHSGTPTARHAQPTHPPMASFPDQTTRTTPFSSGATFQMSQPYMQSPATRPISPSGLSVPSSLRPGQRSPTPTGRHSPSPNSSPNSSPHPHPHIISNNRSTQASSLSGPQPTEQSTGSEFVRLPNSPPSPRIASRLSLYSTYSYYQLDDSRTSSPSTPGPNATEFGVIMPPNSVPSNNNNNNNNDDVHKATPRSQAPTPTPATPGPPTAEDYLILGIQHHEANRLQESAVCFERAATLDGGCGVGMLMWGLTLRHAWGVSKDEKAAFIWLRRAAESAVEDLEAAREGKEQVAVKAELVLAIYEVGQCFFHGWGVHQDKKMAVSYFQVAARLGDADAQQELAFCFANGKGCKKDRKEAAKWYRAAVEQGASSVGLAWIYKSKFL